MTAQPRPVIEFHQAVAIIVGIVIGAGIFKAPALVAGMAGSAGWMFAAWVLGGVVSLIGALCYAELATASRMPAATTTSCAAPTDARWRSCSPGRDSR